MGYYLDDDSQSVKANSGSVLISYLDQFRGGPNLQNLNELTINELRGLNAALADPKKLQNLRLWIRRNSFAKHLKGK